MLNSAAVTTSVFRPLSNSMALHLPHRCGIFFLMYLRSKIADIFAHAANHDRVGLALNCDIQDRTVLIHAAEDDAADFLQKHPNLWHGHNPVNLAQQLAADLLDRNFR